jgi:hypothetical protein
MRCGRAGRHQLGFSFHFFRAPLASFPYSRCQTAHPPSLKLRRASEQARHSPGVGGHPSAPKRGRRSAGDGSLAFPSRLRGATPYLPCDGRAPLGAPAWRFSAAGPALHLPAVPTGIRAAISPTARRSQAPGRSGPAPPKPRFAPRPGTPLPHSALGASPETPLVSEDGCTHILSAK